MRAFIVSFIATGLVCAAVWYYWHGEAAQHRTTLASQVNRLRAVASAPVTAPDVAARRLAAAQRIWTGLSDRESGDVQITVDHWAALDAVSDADIAAWAAGMKPDHYDRLWKAAMMRWASLDGKAAVAHARNYPYGFQNIIGELFACWMRRDPAGCAAEMATLRVSGDTIAAVTTLAQTNLSSALDVVARQLAGGTNENNEWSEDAHPGFLGVQMRDPARKAEFIRWLKNCADPVTASRVFSLVFLRMEHADGWLRPERMPDYMPGADQLPPTLEHPDTVWTMGALAEGQNPLNSLRDKELALFPERTDAPKRYSISNRIYYWASRDPESAGLWLKAQQPSPQLDAAVRGYLLAVAGDDPAAAVLWAGKIEDPGERVRQSADHYVAWYHRQPAEAEAWLAAAGFTETHRLYIAGLAARKSAP